MRLRSPTTGRELLPDGTFTLTDGRERWPVVAGIPYLRTGREALVADAIDALDAGDVTSALLALLADQDDWWDGPVPAREELLAALQAPTLRTAMEHLGFGRVGDYFAFRWSDPTFLSALALLDAHAGGARSAFELGCGAGHLLRELARRRVAVAGGDVVFAKLWLARRFVVPGAELVCFDAGAPFPLADPAFDLALCHDAVHYLPDIPHAVAELRRAGANVVLGHAHNAAVDNASPGAPLDAGGYAALLADRDDLVLYDDAELTQALVAGEAPRPRRARDLARADAIALAAGGRPADGAYGLPPAGTRLRVNPLLDGDRVRWPSERYRDEYGSLSDHLTAPYTVPAGPLVAGVDDAVDALARRRVLVDLPREW